MMEYRLLVRDHLPHSFEHHIIRSKSNADEVVMRANVQTEDDIKKWISEFGRSSRTQWNLRTTKPKGTYVICMKKFVCHHSSFGKIAPSENRKSSSSKNAECNASITISIKAYSERLRLRKDAFMKAGLWGNIRISTVHTHEFDTKQMLRYLQDKDGHLRDMFFKYFSCGMVVAEARKHHQSLLVEQGMSEMDLADGSRNPTVDTVSYWFKQWRNMKSSPKTHEPSLNDTPTENSSISQNGIVQIDANLFVVPSGKNDENSYTVESDGSCTCPAGLNGEYCEHKSSVYQFFGVCPPPKNVSEDECPEPLEEDNSELSQRDILIQSIFEKIRSFEFDEEISTALKRFAARIQNVQSKSQLLRFLHTAGSRRYELGARIRAHPTLVRFREAEVTQGRIKLARRNPVKSCPSSLKMKKEIEECP